MLDISFDVADIYEDSISTLEFVKDWHDGPDRSPGALPFDQLRRDQRWDLLHEAKVDGLTVDVWPSKVSACMAISNLDLLRLDLSNCRCLAGCCRLSPSLLGTLDDWRNEDDDEREYLKRIEVVGILERERDACRDALNDTAIPLDRVFFVDSRGCTCEVSTSVSRIPVRNAERTPRKDQAEGWIYKVWICWYTRTIKKNSRAHKPTSRWRSE